MKPCAFARRALPASSIAASTGRLNDRFFIAVSHIPGPPAPAVTTCRERLAGYGGLLSRPGATAPGQPVSAAVVGVTGFSETFLQRRPEPQSARQSLMRVFDVEQLCEEIGSALHSTQRRERIHPD